MNCEITKAEKESIEIIAKYELDFYRQVFQIRKIPTISIMLYGDEKKYRDAEKCLPRYARGSVGYYRPGSRKVCVLKNEIFVKTTYHELNHLFFENYMAKIPDWINEGLACYFEQTKINSADNVSIKQWEFGKRKMKELVRKKKFDLKWLVSASYKKFHKRHEQNHYVASWAIVYYLMKTKQKVLVDIIKNLKSKTGSEDAINQCYGGGVEQLEKDIYNYYE